MTNLTKILVCPDTHFPYHDKQAWKTVLKVAEVWKPDHWIFLGDGIDNYCVSRYRKNPKKVLPLKEEVRLTNLELDKVSKLDTRVTYLEGNHEERLADYLVDHADALLGLVDMKDLLKIQERGWEWRDYGKHYTVGKLHFVHDLGYTGPNAARMSLQAFGGNVIFGHTHRAQTVYTSSLNGECHVAHTMGWLGDLNALEYGVQVRMMKETNLGFGIAYVRKNDGVGWAHFVPVINGTACVEGKFIRG